MSQPPAGAQYSPDGTYWWDESGQQWVPVSGSDQHDDASASPAAGSADSSSSKDAGSSPAIDTSGLVATLQAIASMDAEALARSSSGQFDEWIESLKQWHDFLSGGQGVA